jgi:hypothetical protein
MEVRWVDAGWRLPAAANLPVEVVLADGSTEKRSELSGDWRPVVRWRTIDKEAGSRKKKV